MPPRPLSEGQIQYAASDAYYLLDIFDLFLQKITTEGNSSLVLVSEHYFLVRSSLSTKNDYHL